MKCSKCRIECRVPARCKEVICSICNAVTGANNVFDAAAAHRCKEIAGNEIRLTDAEYVLRWVH